MASRVSSLRITTVIETVIKRYPTAAQKNASFV